MTKYLKFGIENVSIKEEENNSQFATAKIQAFSSDKNRHDLTCSEEVLMETAPSIYNKPILYTVDKNFDDFYTHVEPDKSMICGFVVPDSAEFSRLEDGRLALNVVARIWKRYAPKVIELFQRDGARKKISVEMEVFDIQPSEDGMLSKMISFAYSGICLLGDFITEASPGANMEMLSFSKEKKEYAEDYKKEFSDKYSELDFTIPNSVKKNASKALEAKKGSSVSLAIARYLVANEKAEPSRIKQMAKFFKNKNLKEVDEVTLGLYGGKQGFTWSQELMKQIIMVDEKNLSYYSNEEENKSKEAIINMAKAKELETSDVEEKEIDMAKPESEEKPEDEKAETPEEEKKEKEDGEEKKFSYAEIFGSDEMFAQMFADEEDDEEDEKSKFSLAKEEFGVGANPAIMMSAMFAKMSKMAKKLAKQDADSKVYMAENEELKKFKADVEANQKDFAVNSTLKELSDKKVISEEAMVELKSESEKYSFAEIDGWKNFAKAKTFDFKDKKAKEKDEDDEVTKYAFPFANGVGSKVVDSPWPISNN